MAGLSAAWLLNREGFRVSVFEKGPTPGFSVNSRDFADHFPDTEEDLFGDVPSRMFNETLWPTLVGLYHQAGVEFDRVDHKQTFSRDDQTLLKIGLPYRLSGLLSSALNPKARRLFAAINRFRQFGIEALQTGTADGITFGDFLDSLSKDLLPPDLTEGFLIPALTSTVFTCSQDDLLKYPCRIVLSALQKISGADPLMRTVQGSRAAANRLLKGVDSIQFNTAVSKVSSVDESAILLVNDKELHFDHVVVATQANHASQLVEESLPDEARLLKKFRYVDVPVVVHTDSSVLPGSKSDWSTFNFDSRGSESACTVWMNRFHPRWPDSQDIFHTIFPWQDIDPTRTLSSVVMQRPLVDLETRQLHQSLDMFHSRERRVWFAGSWAAAGVPLLESAVVSSQTIVSRLTEHLVKAVV